jgi:metal-responsive CopG/Arc/MetJ family transcriptional regulator
MATKTKRAVSPKAATQTLRASVSFPRDLYDTLERIAKERKVSLAWIVRDAAEKYVGDQWPLFDDRRKGA